MLIYRNKRTGVEIATLCPISGEWELIEEPEAEEPTEVVEEQTEAEEPQVEEPKAEDAKAVPKKPKRTVKKK